MKDQINHFLNTSGRSPKTVKTYRYSLKRFVEIVGDDAELNEATYEKFLKAIRNLSPSSQRVYRTSVLKLYEFHKAGDWFEIRRITNHYAKKEGKRNPKFNREAIEKVIAYCETLGGDLPALRDRAFVLTLADTGLRISEACSLNRGDVDWREQRADVIGKGDKQATVFFSDRSIAALQRYLAERQKIDGIQNKPLNSLPLFSTHWSEKTVSRMKSGSMWKAVKARIEEAGVKRADVRIHDFRHYFVSTVYLETGDIKATKELARHERMTTTDRYTHFVSDLAKIYDKVFNKK
jgi:integrase/recombinase XerC